jgi:FkbM family methyltransferase
VPATRMRLRAAVSGTLDRVPRIGAQARARFGGSREPEIEVLAEFVSWGDTVVDVGAHRGVYTWHLARIVGSTGRVLAFEPQPDLAAYLQKAFARSHRVSVASSALSDEAGKATLTIPVWGSTAMVGHATLEGGGEIGIAVPRCTLDSLDVSPTFVKIDVEGHEAAVLRGARQTIEQHRPTLLIEIDRRRVGMSNVQEDVVAFVLGHGYKASYLASDGILHAVEPARLVDPDDPIDNGRYVYNFFFT